MDCYGKETSRSTSLYFLTCDYYQYNRAIVCAMPCFITF